MRQRPLVPGADHHHGHQVVVGFSCGRCQVKSSQVKSKCSFFKRFFHLLLCVRQRPLGPRANHHYGHQVAVGFSCGRCQVKSSQVKSKFTWSMGRSSQTSEVAGRETSN